MRLALGGLSRTSICLTGIVNLADPRDLFGPARQHNRQAKEFPNPSRHATDTISIPQPLNLTTPALWITSWESGDFFRFNSKAKNWARWHLPGDRPQPYAVYVDETDAVWVSDWGANAIVRIDPKTEKFG